MFDGATRHRRKSVCVVQIDGHLEELAVAERGKGEGERADIKVVEWSSERDVAKVQLAERRHQVLLRLRRLGWRSYLDALDLRALVENRGNGSSGEIWAEAERPGLTRLLLPSEAVKANLMDRLGESGKFEDEVGEAQEVVEPSSKEGCPLACRTVPTPFDESERAGFFHIDEAENTVENMVREIAERFGLVGVEGEGREGGRLSFKGLEGKAMSVPARREFCKLSDLTCAVSLPGCTAFESCESMASSCDLRINQQNMSSSLPTTFRLVQSCPRAAGEP